MSRRSYPHPVTLYLSTTQYEALRKRVKKTKLDASKHLRVALDQYLDTSALKRKKKTALHDKRQRAIPTGEVLPVVTPWSPGERR